MKKFKKKKREVIEVMKKSFLKRVMAAAIAVPVALTQTVMFTSGAEETSEPEVLGKGTFLTISDPDSDKTFPKNSLDGYALAAALKAENAEVSEAKYAFVQESDWYSRLNTALTVIAGQNGTEVNIDPKRLADLINYSNPYADILVSVLNDENTTAVAKVYAHQVIVTVNVNYNYGEALETLVGENMPEGYEDIELNIRTPEAVNGTIDLLIDAADLLNKNVSVSMPKNTIFAPNAVAALDYIQSLYKDAQGAVRDALGEKKKEVDAQVKEKRDEYNALIAAGVPEDHPDAVAADNAIKDAEKEAQRVYTLADEKMQEVFDLYQSRLDKVRKVYNQFEGHREATIEAENVDAFLKEFREKAMGANGGTVDGLYAEWAEKLPQSLDGIQGHKYFDNAAALLAEIIAQANVVAEKNGYTIEVTADDLMGVAKDVYDLTVHGASEKWALTGEATGYISESLKENEPEVYSYYETYFNEKLAADNMVVDTVESAWAFEVTGNADATDFTADGYLNLYRIVWYTATPVDETTTTTTETETTTTTTETETTTTSTETTTTSTETETTTTSTETETTTTSTETETTTTSTETETTTTSTETETTTTSTETETTTSTDETTTTPSPYAPVEVEVVKEGVSFHFSHDERPFDPAQLLDVANATVKDADGNVAPAEASLFGFSLTNDGVTEGLSAADVYAARVAGEGHTAVKLYVYYDGQPVSMAALPEVFVGVKGDVNLDGVVEAADSARILVYAAEIGAGNKDAHIGSATNETLDKFVYFLSDVNGESSDLGATDASGNAESILDASDAAYILVHAAVAGAGKVPDWKEDVLLADTPAISEAIHAYKEGK